MKITITKRDILNHKCVVDGYFKLYDKYWIKHKCLSIGGRDYIYLN